MRTDRDAERPLGCVFGHEVTAGPSLIRLSLGRRVGTLEHGAFARQIGREIDATLPGLSVRAQDRCPLGMGYVCEQITGPGERGRPIGRACRELGCMRMRSRTGTRQPSTLTSSTWNRGGPCPVAILSADATVFRVVNTHHDCAR